jgi:GntR family transcriptional regulator, transcriptional repressor for pyruvate dehydrogenase complex
MSDVSFDPVRRTPSLSDTIAERLLEAILGGRFREGDLLPSERELAEQFGVSRTVVREAIRALVVRGVVHVKSGRGIEIAALDATPVTAAMSLLLRGSDAIGFEQIHEVRAMLEIHIAGLAAERSTPADHAALEERIAAMESTDGDVGTLAGLMFEFHRTLAKATHNELYVVLLDSIAGGLVANRRAVIAASPVPARMADHRRILEKVKTRDPATARRAMERHLARSLTIWRSVAAQGIKESAGFADDWKSESVIN